MKTIYLLLLLPLALVFAGCETTQSGTSNRAPAVAPTQYDDAIARAETLGRKIHFHDQLAWHATDLILEQNIDLEAMHGLGWITVETEEGWMVKFLDDEEGMPKVLYEIVFPPEGAEGKGTLRKARTREMTEAEKVMLLARDKVIALARDKGMCDDTLNFVVFSNPYGEGYYAYALTPVGGDDVVRFGGYYRIQCSATGEVIDARRFANSCLEVGPNSTNREEGHEMVAVVASHGLDPHPTEIHVFLSLQHPYMIGIVTREHVWEIEQGKVRWAMSTAAFGD